jgi:hypothetical protein
MSQMPEDPKETEEWESRKERIIKRWSVEDEEETQKWEDDKEEDKGDDKDGTAHDGTTS